MKMTSLKINGRTVSRLFINGREVALGSASSDALCFTAKDNNSTIQLTKVGNPNSINLQTSTNGISWTPYNVGDTITINSGEKVYFKAVGSNYTLASGPSGFYKFVTTGEFEASGNVNSLLEENEETARTMSLENRQFCYVYLFSGAALTTAPELPATTLAYGCYAMMFKDCALLTQAPVLPATTLANFCYYYMFENCTSLAEAPTLPAYQLVDNCYAYMFQGCTSLTQAPELPATTLANSCYEYMFYNCNSLNSIKVAFTTWGSETSNWLNNVANSGTFECPQALIDNMTTRGGNTVPESWNMVAV